MRISYRQPRLSQSLLYSTASVMLADIVPSLPLFVLPVHSQEPSTGLLLLILFVVLLPVSLGSSRQRQGRHAIGVVSTTFGSPLAVPTLASRPSDNVIEVPHCVAGRLILHK